VQNVDFTALSCAIVTATTPTLATTTTVAAMRASVKPCGIANCNTDAFNTLNIKFASLRSIKYGK
jgi:hypothetical protein